MIKITIILLFLQVSLVFGQTSLILNDKYNTAEKLYIKKSYDKVIEITSEALNGITSNDSLYREILALEALTYFKAKDFNKAIDDWKKLINIKPDDMSYYVATAASYSELKDFENCYLFLDKGYQVNSKNEYLLHNMARYHNIGKDYDKAIHYCDLALDLNLDAHWRSTTLIERSKSYVNLKMFEKALKDCDKSISISPKDNLAYYYRALSNIGLNKLETVCSDLEKAKNYAAGNLTKDLMKKYCEK